MNLKIAGVIEQLVKESQFGTGLMDKLKGYGKSIVNNTVNNNPQARLKQWLDSLEKEANKVLMLALKLKNSKDQKDIENYNNTTLQFQNIINGQISKLTAIGKASGVDLTPIVQSLSQYTKISPGQGRINYLWKNVLPVIRNVRSSLGNNQGKKTPPPLPGQQQAQQPQQPAQQNTNNSSNFSPDQAVADLGKNPALLKQVSDLIKQKANTKTSSALTTTKVAAPQPLVMTADQIADYAIKNQSNSNDSLVKYLDSLGVFGSPTPNKDLLVKEIEKALGDYSNSIKSVVSQSSKNLLAEYNGKKAEIDAARAKIESSAAELSKVIPTFNKDFYNKYLIEPFEAEVKNINKAINGVSTYLNKQNNKTSTDLDALVKKINSDVLSFAKRANVSNFNKFVKIN